MGGHGGNDLTAKDFQDSGSWYNNIMPRPIGRFGCENEEFQRLLRLLPITRQLHSIWPDRWHVICPHLRYMDHMIREANLPPMEGIFVAEEHHLLGLPPTTPIVLAGDFHTSPFFYRDPLKALRFIIARFRAENVIILKPLEAPHV
jgi:hypothetical protein